MIPTEKIPIKSPSQSNQVFVTCYPHIITRLYTHTIQYSFYIDNQAPQSFPKSTGLLRANENVPVTYHQIITLLYSYIYIYIYIHTYPHIPIYIPIYHQIFWNIPSWIPNFLHLFGSWIRCCHASLSCVATIGHRHSERTSWRWSLDPGNIQIFWGITWK